MLKFRVTLSLSHLVRLLLLTARWDGLSDDWMDFVWVWNCHGNEGMFKAPDDVYLTRTLR